LRPKALEVQSTSAWGQHIGPEEVTEYIEAGSSTLILIVFYVPRSNSFAASCRSPGTTSETSLCTRSRPRYYLSLSRRQRGSSRCGVVRGPKDGLAVARVDAFCDAAYEVWRKWLGEVVRVGLLEGWYTGRTWRLCTERGWAVNMVGC